MTLPVVNVKLEVFDPTSFPNPSSEDRVIQQDRIKRITITERLDDTQDSATIELYNDNGDALADVPLHARVDVIVETVTDGGVERRLFTAYPTDRTATKDNRTGGQNTLTLQCADFVMGRLRQQLISNAFRDQQVFGSNDAIVDTIVDEAENISLGGTFPSSPTLTIGWNYNTLLTAIREVAQRTGAIISSSKTSLLFDETRGISPQFTVASEDIEHPKSYSDGDDLLKNRVVVVGGEGSRQDASQTTQSTLERVTNSAGDYAFAVALLAKNRVSQVEVYTDPDSNSTDGLRVRLHKVGSNNDPIGPDDPNQALAQTTVPAGELTDGGFTTFNVSGTGLPDKVAVIADATGSTGHDVGTDGTNSQEVLTYKLFYSFAVVAEDTDRTSQLNYLTTETRENTNIVSKPAAEEMAKAEIERHDLPEAFYEVDAARNRSASDEDRMHKLDAGETVKLKDTDFNISGSGGGAVKHVVARKVTTISDSLTVSLRFQDVSTLL